MSEGRFHENDKAGVFGHQFFFYFYMTIRNSWKKKNILLERTKSANHNFRLSDHIWAAKLTLTLTELK